MVDGKAHGLYMGPWGRPLQLVALAFENPTEDTDGGPHQVHVPTQFGGEIGLPILLPLSEGAAHRRVQKNEILVLMDLKVKAQGSMARDSATTRSSPRRLALPALAKPCIVSFWQCIARGTVEIFHCIVMLLSLTQRAPNVRCIFCTNGHQRLPWRCTTFGTSNRP